MKKQFDFLKLCTERGIATKTAREGWLQTNCPFCNDSEYHLGFKLNGSYFNCYRCGGMSAYKVVDKLFPGEIKTLWRDYTQQNPVVQLQQPLQQRRLKVSLQLPETTDLTSKAIQYLSKRNYEPNELSKLWGVRSTTHIGKYSFRLFMPITFKNKVVTFQTRDVTGKHDATYLAASADEEARSIKKCLYGYDEAKKQDWPFVVVFEGIPAVWRFGYGSVATFGVEYTQDQLKLLLEWDIIVVMFDNDGPGKRAGRKLVDELLLLGKRAFCGLTEDVKAVDELSQQDADKLRREMAQLFL